MTRAVFHFRWSSSSQRISACMCFLVFSLVFVVSVCYSVFRIIPSFLLFPFLKSVRNLLMARARTERYFTLSDCLFLAL